MSLPQGRKPFIVSFIRHGQTRGNSKEEDFVQSTTGGELTERGIQMARTLGKHLGSTQVNPVTRVYCSDLKRTIDTALNIKEGGLTSLPAIQLAPAVRERDHGDLEFFSNEITRQIPSNGPTPPFYTEIPVPSGEATEKFLGKCQYFFNKLCNLADSTTSPEHILVVSHGGWIRVLIKWINEERKSGGRFQVEGWDDVKASELLINTSQTRVQILGLTQDGRRILQFTHFNDIQHLDPSLLKNL